MDDNYIIRIKVNFLLINDIKTIFTYQTIKYLNSIF